MAKPVTVVTGASAGLGVEFARQLAGQGHRLVLVARRKDRLQELAKEVGDARVLALDLSVNNAGFGLAGRFAELDAGRQREMIDLNCGALEELSRAVLPGMIARKSGRILNVASTAAFQPG